MMDIFHTLAEVSVAIAGFSSLIIIFRGSSVDWSRLDYVQFAFVLSWSIGSVFLSLLPILLVEFGSSVAEASRVGLFGWVAYFVTAAGVLMEARRRVYKELGERPPVSWALNVAFMIVLIVSFAAGLGVLPGPAHAWYAFAIIFMMVGAIANLGGIVLHTMRKPGAD